MSWYPFVMGIIIGIEVKFICDSILNFFERKRRLKEQQEFMMSVKGHLEKIFEPPPDNLVKMAKERLGKNNEPN